MQLDDPTSAFTLGPFAASTAQECCNMCGTHNNQAALHSATGGRGRGNGHEHGSTVINPYPPKGGGQCAGTVFQGSECFIKLKVGPMIPETPAFGEAALVACIYNGWIAAASPKTSPAMSTRTTTPVVTSVAATSPTHATNRAAEDGGSARHAPPGAAAIGGAAAGGSIVLAVLLFAGVRYWKAKGAAAAKLSKQTGYGTGIYSNALYHGGQLDVAVDDAGEALLRLDPNGNSDDDDALIA